MLPDDLPTFLKNDGNKTLLNKIISQHAARPLFWKLCDAEIVITRNSRIWSKADGPKELVPWVEQVHEEADNRMVAHIMDMLKQDNNIESVCVRTADSDVIAILVAFMAEFKALLHFTERPSTYFSNTG